MKINSLIFYKDKSSLDVSGVIDVEYDKTNGDIIFNIYKRKNTVDSIVLQPYSVNGNHFYALNKSNKDISKTILNFISDYRIDCFSDDYFNQSNLDIFNYIDFQRFK